MINYIKIIDDTGDITVEMLENITYVFKQSNGYIISTDDINIAEGILSSDGVTKYQLKSNPTGNISTSVAEFISAGEYYELLEQLNKSEEDENSSSEDTNEGE